MWTLIKALFLGILGGLLFVGTAYAHAAYLRSNPGADAILADPPTRVEIWFSQELYRRPGQNTILVTSLDGAVVSLGDTLIDDDDRTHAWVDLKPGLSPGNYTVTWKNLSIEDGHDGEGVFTFTIDPQAEVTSTPMMEPVPTNTKTPAEAAPSTSTPVPVHPAPTADLPVEPTPTGGGMPCAASLVPVFGMVGIMVLHRRNKARA